MSANKELHCSFFEFPGYFVNAAKNKFPQKFHHLTIENNIAHLDIKPENILIHPSGNPM
jgi:serine/threonine protein kinase